MITAHQAAAIAILADGEIYHAGSAYLCRDAVFGDVTELAEELQEDSRVEVPGGGWDTKSFTECFLAAAEHLGYELSILSRYSLDEQAEGNASDYLAELQFDPDLDGDALTRVTRDPAELADLAARLVNSDDTEGTLGEWFWDAIELDDYAESCEHCGNPIS